MKCPKCGYHSFDHLDSCKKCSTDLTEHKAKFNLRGFFFPGQTAETPAAAPAAFADESDEEVEQASDGSVDFGFDFLDEEEDPIAEPASATSLGDDEQDVNIDQPFGADSETIPADEPAAGEDGDNDKPEKGPEFAF
jgi:hypothetical protein